ncbi:MAG TPA: bifunctional oligoribonuclease/PAP phosphatase NrnA [Acidimicrobiia bacterium]|nr:bifunctional oligoribonuclease/PAP phosphatase NrnA [Acidimicrobiia bacterium]
MNERSGVVPAPAADPDFDRAVEVIGAASQVALACHVNPDGDALGSMLGMFHALRGAGRDVVASFPPPFEVARHYRELPGLELLTPPEEFPDEPAVMVTFDCGSLDRLGGLDAPAKSATELIVVDHHISNDRYGSINVIQPDAAASGTVALELIDALGFALDRDAAVCLYAALVCDTGRFQYDTTTPAVFDTARRLSEFDLPIASLSRSLFEEHSFAYLQMLGEALQSAVLVREQRLLYTAITQDLLTRHGVRLDEVEGLIDVLRRATEAEVTCVLKEEPDGTIRVSLRSLGDIDVRRVAEAHGGGGHRFAAGFSSDLDLDTVIARIRAAI